MPGICSVFFRLGQATRSVTQSRSGKPGGWTLISKRTALAFTRALTIAPVPRMGLDSPHISPGQALKARHPQPNH